MKKLIALITISVIASLSMPAIGGHRTHETNFEKRLDRQEIRIKKGIRNGELTRNEARKLWKKHHHITRLYSHYLEDGHLSRRERNKLTEKLNRNSDRIWQLKHNDRQRDHYTNHHHNHDSHAHNNSRSYWSHGGRKYDKHISRSYAYPPFRW